MNLQEMMSPDFKTIVFEGMDGGGKRTQTLKLKEKLEGYGFASFPDYKSDLGQLVRDYLVNPDIHPRDLTILTNVKLDSLSYIMDRMYWAKENNVKMCDNTIFDRYYTSNILYQTIYLDDKDLCDYIEWLEYIEVIKNGLNRPDIVFCLVSDPRVNMKNIKERGRETDHFETLDMQQKVFNNAQRISQALGWHLINVNNINGNMRTVEDIHEEVIGHLCR